MPDRSSRTKMGRESLSDRYGDDQNNYLDRPVQRHDTRSGLLHPAALPLGSLIPADAAPTEAEILLR
jgi:hypothetical protein